MRGDGCTNLNTLVINHLDEGVEVRQQIGLHDKYLRRRHGLLNLALTSCLGYIRMSFLQLWL